MDEAFVRDLLRDQHPDLAGLPLRPVPGGWGNQMWRLGDDLAVRMPRQEGASELLRMEHRWLPQLAPTLPLPVSAPVRVGEPSERFPKTWTINAWVHGEPADRADLSADAAEGLAEFLLALHRPAPTDAPIDVDRVALTPHPKVPAELRADYQRALVAPVWAGPPVWRHADLHPANVVARDGVLSGVIDWGSLSGGDPAIDLASAWVLLPDTDRFFDAYRPDEATVLRAKGWAIGRALFLVDIGELWEQGRPGGQPGWGARGQEVLRRLMKPTTWTAGARPSGAGRR
ncbi:aminoglycoside phosphotransferase family protein [Kutzneria sp. NPDC051319]|uniref:aminoglycoside phosphotransferase family protein n=1 Tax=Kutzneria sp. NPDC051319 TaxID=3155047 RepID=UPI0034361E99